MKIFNQLDFSKEISNLQILENNIIIKNFAKNSILVRCFDIKNELMIEICFAKGKKTNNGNNSLFKIMQGYKNNSKNKNVYNLGIPIHHFFWIRKYDINSGELINKKYCHYYEIQEILELNNIHHLFLASKQKERNKTPEEMKIIRKEYDIFKQWYENEYTNDQDIKKDSKKTQNKYKEESAYLDSDISSSKNEKEVIQNIFD